MIAASPLAKIIQLTDMTSNKEHYEKLAREYATLADQSHNLAAGGRGKGDVSSFEQSAMELKLESLKYEEKAKIEDTREKLNSIKL